MTILTTSSLKKEFNHGFSLGPISLSLQGGETISIFGINGAGKSTLFQLLTGNLSISEGKIFLENELLSPKRSDLKRLIGYLPQENPLPSWATPRDLLRYSALLRGDDPDKIEKEALDKWDCSYFAHLPLASCSYGMQKRVALALATFHKPRLLILDEPFSGLDMVHIFTLEDTLQERQKYGLTSIFSTHHPHYAAKLCEKAYIIQKGHLDEILDWSKATTLGRISLVETYFSPQKA